MKNSSRESFDMRGGSGGRQGMDSKEALLLKQQTHTANKKRLLERMPTKSDRQLTENRLASLNNMLSKSDWQQDLNDFMTALSEFLCATASQNNFGSICSQICVALANSIQISEKQEDFSHSDDMSSAESAKAL